jgi:imidazole glycerol-phosphate synthase subunit HisH
MSRPFPLGPSKLDAALTPGVDGAGANPGASAGGPLATPAQTDTRSLSSDSPDSGLTPGAAANRTAERITPAQPRAALLARGVQVAVYDSGVSNLASIVAALRRLGSETEIIRSAEALENAERLVLPGVGSFGAATRALEMCGARAVLRRRLERGQATLAICLGMQLFAEGSDEAPGEPGLGLLPGQVTRFPTSVSVPQLGWNWVRAEAGAGLLQSGHFCFANSFRLTQAPAGWRIAWADHGGPFVAALERGALVGCQFHPELSGAAGATLLARWLALNPQAPAPSC